MLSMGEFLLRLPVYRGGSKNSWDPSHLCFHPVLISNDFLVPCPGTPGLYKTIFSFGA